MDKTTVKAYFGGLGYVLIKGYSAVVAGYPVVIHRPIVFDQAMGTITLHTHRWNVTEPLSGRIIVGGIAYQSAAPTRKDAIKHAAKRIHQWETMDRDEALGVRIMRLAAENPTDVPTYDMTETRRIENVHKIHR